MEIMTVGRLPLKKINLDRQKRQQATMGFVQVWLEVVAIISSAYPSICLGLTNIAKHWFLIFIFIKSRAVVTGGRNSNATPAQSPVVGCYIT